MKGGRDWARVERTVGCMGFCTGADADRLRSRLDDVVQPEIKRNQLTRVMQWGMWVGGTSGSGGIRYRIREFGCEEQLRSVRYIQKRSIVTFVGTPRSPVVTGTEPAPVKGNGNRGSYYEYYT